MSIKWKFILTGLFFYLVAGLLLFQLLDIDRLYFIGGEMLLFVSVLLFVSLYKQLVKPIETISSAVHFLKEKDFSTRLATVNQKEIDQLIDVYNKMSEQLHHERVQHEEKNLFLDRLIDASPSAIFILNGQEDILRMNPSALKLFALSEHPSQPLPLVELPEPWFEKLSHLKQGDRVNVRIDGIRQFKVSYNSFLNKGFSQPFIIIEELTRELLRAERQSYEKVIRMMSHEVNNSVGAVNSVMQSVLTLSDQLDVEIREDVSHALKVAMDRNISLNRFMGNFADVVKLPMPVLQTIDLSEVVYGIIDLFQTELHSRNIRLKKNLSVCMIDADKVQIEQLLVNIIKNSVEAIGSEGKIGINILNKPLALAITDNGHGFSSEAFEKLFTPFFSSKKTGQGIGLTVVREILLNHGFQFKLHRKEKNLTEFYIEF